MGLKISDLLKWRTDITLKDLEGKDIIDPTTDQPVTLWLRIIGDEDLQETYKKARAASSLRRKSLLDKVSDDYFAAIDPIREGTREELVEIIKAARTSNLAQEAQVNVVRPDEVEIEAVAVDPDAPTLEEQEKLDAANQKQEDDYNKALGEYQLTRIAILDAELEAKTLEELRAMAEDDVITIVAQSAYIGELIDQKLWRAVYLDKTCRERAFDSVEDWRQTDQLIKDQLIERYLKLEQNPDEIKN